MKIKKLKELKRKLQRNEYSYSCRCSNVHGYQQEKFIFQEDFDKLSSEMISPCTTLLLPHFRFVMNNVKVAVFLVFIMSTGFL